MNRARVTQPKTSFYICLLDTTRVILSACHARSIAQGKKDEPVPDSEVIKVCKSLAESARINIESAKKLGRDPEKYVQELEIIENYLPQPLSPAELTDAIISIIGGRRSITLGDVMKELKASNDGLYDGKLASTIARTLLEKTDA